MLRFSARWQRGAAVAAFAGTRPDPAVQAQRDGCGRNGAGLFKKEQPTWAYVGDAATSPDGPPPPVQTATGVVSATPAWLGAHPADIDDPVTHTSFDFLVNVKPDAPSGFLLGTGNFAGAGESEEAGRLHTEWEQAAFPAFAWPSPGDRVQLTGNWVWDCGHWLGGGERTELHPIRAFWVQRQGVSPRSATGEAEGDLVISTDGTPAGASANCQHRTRGDKAAFKACLAADPGWQDVSGSYRFALAAPPRPSAKARLRVRVVDAGSTAGAPAVKAVPGPKGAIVTVDVSTPPGRRVVIAKRVLVGWDTAPNARTPAGHVRPDPRPPLDRPRLHRARARASRRPASARSRSRPASGRCTAASQGSGAGGRCSARSTDRRSASGGGSTSISARGSPGGSSSPGGSATTAALAPAASPGRRRPARPGPASSSTSSATTRPEWSPTHTRRRGRPSASTQPTRRSRLVLPAGEHARLLPGRLSGCCRALTGIVSGMPTQRKQQKDVVARLSDSGEEALQRFLQNPGTAKVVGAANAMKERVDELTRRMRSLDPLEKRVAELERRLDELSKPKRTTAAKKTATRKPAAKKPSS